MCAHEHWEQGWVRPIKLHATAQVAGKKRRARRHAQNTVIPVFAALFVLCVSVSSVKERTSGLASPSMADV